MSEFFQSKPRAFNFSHQLKPELERWLILGGRLREIEEAVGSLVEIYSAAGNGPDLTLSSENIRLLRPLYCFSVVTYVRCFGSGTRKRLKIEEVPGLSSRDREAHDAAKHFRDKHFAHAVADEEGALVLAIPRQANTEPGFVVLEATVTTPNAADMAAFLAVVQKVNRFVRSKEHETGDELALVVLGSSLTWAQALRNGAARTPTEA